MRKAKCVALDSGVSQWRVEMLLVSEAAGATWLSDTQAKGVDRWSVSGEESGQGRGTGKMAARKSPFSDWKAKS